MKTSIYMADPHSPGRHNSFLGGDYFDQGDGWNFTGKIRYTPTIINGEYNLEFEIEINIPSWGNRKKWWKFWQDPEIIINHKIIWIDEKGVHISFKDEQVVLECN